MINPKKLIGLDFEVYGKVQGVYFRKHTKEEAKRLNIRGWCMNTENGTVRGYIEGEFAMIEMMKRWLKITGSPKSRIAKADFGEESELKAYTYKSFEIQK